MYKQDLALNNQPDMKCHKIQPTHLSYAKFFKPCNFIKSNCIGEQF